MTEEQDWGALEESGDETAYLLRSEEMRRRLLTTRLAMIAPSAMASASATLGWRLDNSEKRIGVSAQSLQALPACTVALRAM